MVAYSFQPQFVDPIRSGRKRHTVRAIGKRRHARPGEALQLYTGMRTRSCRLQARAVCEKVAPIDIYFCDDAELDYLVIDDVQFRTPLHRNTFARDDGFKDWTELRAFWRKHHPKIDAFDGVIIFWKDMEIVT